MQVMQEAHITNPTHLKTYKTHVHFHHIFKRTYSEISQRFLHQMQVDQLPDPHIHTLLCSHLGIALSLLQFHVDVELFCYLYIPI